LTRRSSPCYAGGMGKTLLKKSLKLLKRVGSVAKDFLELIPTKQDSWAGTAIKVAAAGETVERYLSGGRHKGAVECFFDDLDFETEIHSNQFFVNLFAKREDPRFTRQIIPISVEDVLVVLESEEIGNAYFLYHSRGGWWDDDFWVTKGFDFRAMLDALWYEYGDRIHMEIESTAIGPLPKLSVLPETTDPLLGNVVKRLDDVVAKHRKYQEDGIPRTYLMLGMQGTGKSTFGVRWAQKASGRILRLDTTSWTSSRMNQLDLLIRSLSPNFLMVDDLDHAPNLGDAISRLLTIATDIKHKHPKLTVLLVANGEHQIGPVLGRPGRVDEILDFDPPDYQTRKEILLGYLEEFGFEKQGTKFTFEERGIKITGRDLYKVLMACDGLTAAYLREIALQLRYDTVDRVKEMCERWKSFGSYSKAKKRFKKTLRKNANGKSNGETLTVVNEPMAGDDNVCGVTSNTWVREISG